MSLIWLASYPKSGNTWTRAFLANYISDETVPVQINQLPSTWSHLFRWMFDEVTGLASSDMTRPELQYYRNFFHRELALTATEPLILKSHEAYRRFPLGYSFFGPTSDCKVVHLVRNPLDVAVSFAHHNNRSIAKTLDRMAKPTATMSGGSLRFVEQTGSWSSFNQSWLDQTEIPRLTLKYEDMLRTPEEHFESLLRFVGFDVNLDRLRRAIRFSGFKELQRQERENGFTERPESAKSFFRQGQEGSWRDALTKEQVEAVVKEHGALMTRLDYTVPTP